MLNYMSAANCGIRHNHSKNLLKNTCLIFVDTQVKNYLCSNITKAKSFYSSEVNAMILYAGSLHG